MCDSELHNNLEIDSHLSRYIVVIIIVKCMEMYGDKEFLTLSRVYIHDKCLQSVRLMWTAI